MNSKSAAIETIRELHGKGVIESHEFNLCLKVYLTGFEHAMKQNEKLVELITDFLDVNDGDEECRFDHHGYCQTHFVEEDCLIMRARQVLKEYEESK